MVFYKRFFSGALILGLSFPLISACSSVEDFTKEFAAVANGEVIEPDIEDRMNGDTQKVNQEFDFVDNIESRETIAKVVEDFYIDITGYEATDEELLSIDENFTDTYVSEKTEVLLNAPLISADMIKPDIEESLKNNHTEPELFAAVNNSNEYASPDWLTNYEYLTAVHKVMANTTIGDAKTYHAYEMELNKDTTIPEFEIDESQLIFRENDVIVPIQALKTNLSDNYNIAQIPLRIILENGSWQIDLVNLSTIDHSPLTLKASLNGIETPEDNINIIDNALHKMW